MPCRREAFEFLTYMVEGWLSAVTKGRSGSKCRLGDFIFCTDFFGVNLLSLNISTECMGQRLWDGVSEFFLLIFNPVFLLSSSFEFYRNRLKADRGWKVTEPCRWHATFKENITFVRNSTHSANWMKLMSSLLGKVAEQPRSFPLSPSSLHPFFFIQTVFGVSKKKKPTTFTLVNRALNFHS